MAFGLRKTELSTWKRAVSIGEIAFLTHYWLDDRFPGCYTVTKVGCSDISKLIRWGEQYGLDRDWIDMHPSYPHFDLFGEKQKEILLAEGKQSQIKQFDL